MRFAHPEYLYLLLLVPCLVGLYVYVTMQKKKNLEKLGNIELLRDLMPKYSPVRQAVKFGLMAFAFLIAVFMLARPQFGSRIDIEQRQGIELIVALDISNSMLATDIAPSRLERAKQLVTKLMDEMQDDRLGLIVFAGDAYTQIPITSDFVSVKMFMPTINPSLAPMQGTAIGAAVDMAVRSFEQTERSEPAGRSILLITDGENHEDDAVASAKTAAKAGIVVNVIGIGTEAGAPIPVAGSTDFKRDKSGNVVISKLNVAMCEKVAKAGDGIFAQADNSNNALKIINNELDKLTKGKAEIKKFSEYSEQFQWLAGLLLLVLVCELFLMERKNRWFEKIIQ
ncbi:MAG: VWA domain-containing protein [Prevotellaceae bacterium]|jgi:Ca-activated chloride channel family protein|nr:VWA domain-containing protein [Prevotellaceae bacterium]